MGPGDYGYGDYGAGLYGFGVFSPDWPPPAPYPVTTNVGVERSSGQWCKRKDLFAPR